MLILATYTNASGRRVADLYNCAPALLKKDFSKDGNVDFFLFHISGNNYQERKQAARELATIWSLARGMVPDLSYNEIITITGYFENLALKYGLIQEYRENAII